MRGEGISARHNASARQNGKIRLLMESSLERSKVYIFSVNYIIKQNAAHGGILWIKVSLLLNLLGKIHFDGFGHGLQASIRCKEQEPLRFAAEPNCGFVFRNYFHA